MKISEIRNQFQRVKKLLSEYDMLCCLVKVSKRTSKESGIESDTKYMQNVERRIVYIEQELKKIFSFE